MTDAFEIAVVDHLDCRLDQRAWDFAVERAAEIDAHWAQVLARLPFSYNGQVLLQYSGEIVQDGAVRTYRSR